MIVRLLDSLRGLSRPKAASTFGVLVNAFKRASSDGTLLGVQRVARVALDAVILHCLCATQVLADRARNRASSMTQDQLHRLSCRNPSESDLPVILRCIDVGWSSEPAEEVDKLRVNEDEPEKDDELFP